MTEAFILDPRLQEDTVFISALPLSDMYLMNDRRWPWLVLAPRVAATEEFHQLCVKDRMQLCAEISNAADALKEETGCGKINIGALGNVVRQLHVHIVARNSGDANWPGPVWGFGQRQPYEKSVQDMLLTRYRALFDKRAG